MGIEGPDGASPFFPTLCFLRIGAAQHKSNSVHAAEDHPGATSASSVSEKSPVRVLHRHGPIQCGTDEALTSLIRAAGRRGEGPLSFAVSTLCETLEVGYRALGADDGRGGRQEGDGQADGVVGADGEVVLEDV